MSALSTALSLARLRDESAAWALLRQDNAAVAIAVLGEHLGGEQRRRLTTEVIDLVDADLEQLRSHGFDLPRTAQAYCADWRRAKILISRPSDAGRSETFELSPDALASIRFVADLVQPRQTVTGSRLTMIADGLSSLARQTNEDATARLEQLRAQRERLDDDISRAERGDVTVLAPRAAVEQAREIVALAQQIPLDFARVRADIEQLNRELRERIIDSDDAQRHVLDEIFRGVDLLGESDAGRSFSGFYDLILDPELNALFDASVEQVLDRGFASDLTPDERRELRGLLRTLRDQSREVHDVMTSFARGLRRFVQSQEYQQDRTIRRLLREALADVVPLAQTMRPWASIGFDLPLSSLAIDGVARMSLHNPGEFESPPLVVAPDAPRVDLDQLRVLARDTEIDLAELSGHINTVLAMRSAPSIGDVLERFPATQGIASVVGLFVLVSRHGRRADGVERVVWTAHGSVRAAAIDRYVFTGVTSP